MNATIGFDSNGSWQHLGTNKDNVATNGNGRKLLTLSEEVELFIMNSLLFSKPHHHHTWYSPTGFRKRVDYVLAELHIKNLVQTVGFTEKQALLLKQIIALWHCRGMFHPNLNEILFS